MTPVFLDTVGMVAVWNRSDQWHVAAMAAFTALLQRQVPLITTAYILLECGNEASRRPYRSHIVALRQRLLAGGNLIEPTAAEVHHRPRMPLPRRRFRHFLISSRHRDRSPNNRCEQ